MGVYVSFGVSSVHLNELKEWCKTGKSDSWTVNPRAKPGDRVLFYMLSPMMAFVAVGTVTSPAEFKHSGPWAGKWMADVVVDEMIQDPVSIQKLRENLPEWGFTRRPTNGKVPDDVFDRFRLIAGLRECRPSSSVSVTEPSKERARR